MPLVFDSLEHTRAAQLPGQRPPGGLRRAACAMRRARTNACWYGNLEFKNRRFPQRRKVQAHFQPAPWAMRLAPCAVRLALCACGLRRAPYALREAGAGPCWCKGGSSTGKRFRAPQGASRKPQDASRTPHAASRSPCSGLAEMPISPRLPVHSKTIAGHLEMDVPEPALAQQDCWAYRLFQQGANGELRLPSLSRIPGN